MKRNKRNFISNFASLTNSPIDVVFRRIIFCNFIEAVLYIILQTHLICNPFGQLKINVLLIAENPISIYPINLWKSLQSILMFPKIFGNLITEFMFLKMIRSKTHSTLEKIGLWWKAHMLEYLSSLVVILTLQFISKYHDIQFNIDWVTRCQTTLSWNDILVWKISM